MNAAYARSGIADDARPAKAELLDQIARKLLGARLGNLEIHAFGLRTHTVPKPIELPGKTVEDAVGHRAVRLDGHARMDEIVVAPYRAAPCVEDLLLGLERLVECEPPLAVAMVPEDRLVADDEVGSQLLCLLDDLGRRPDAGHDARALLVHAAIQHLVARADRIDGLPIAEDVEPAAIVLAPLDNLANKHGFNPFDLVELQMSPSSCMATTSPSWLAGSVVLVAASLTGSRACPMATETSAIWKMERSFSESPKA